MTQNLFKTKICKLDLSGAGLSCDTLNGKKLLVWGALPEEEVICNIVKRKRKTYSAIAEKIIKPSKDRVNPLEDHFLSCSVFQILKYSKQINIKKQLAKEQFINMLGLKKEPEMFIENNNIYNYRNKVEFSFTVDNQKLFFAYHKRGQQEKIAVSNCILINKQLQKTLNNLLELLNKYRVENNLYKTIIARCDQNNNVIAGLFIYKEETALIEQLKKADFKKLGLTGFAVYLSPPNSPASVVEKEVFKTGKLELENKINKARLKFGLFSFFQNNPQTFNQIIKDIRKHIDKNSTVLDFYSGVGTIGIEISDLAKKVILVESNQSAYEYSKINIKLNNCDNIESILSTDRKARFLIEKNQILIVDPARSGLNPKLTDHLTTVRPKKIVYLSCNLKTQVQDIKKLIDFYKISFVRLYDLFPNTPHFESLIILEKK